MIKSPINRLYYTPRYWFRSWYHSFSSFTIIKLPFILFLVNLLPPTYSPLSVPKLHITNHQQTTFSFYYYHDYYSDLDGHIQTAHVTQYSVHSHFNSHFSFFPIPCFTPLFLPTQQVKHFKFLVAQENEE